MDELLQPSLILNFIFFGIIVGGCLIAVLLRPWARPPVNEYVGYGYGATPGGGAWLASLLFLMALILLLLMM